MAAETSPYLRQHAENPVDWYPWGPEAFAKAATEDRPVFLSIGYSACHWCHVMAHESFEDPEIAAVLAQGFIAIKVDREERPDVDAVYMEAVQALTGSGGWPMSVFLTPDGRPFFGGTYFPTEDRQGMPSFRTVLDAVGDIWTNRRSDVETQADELAAAIASRSTIAADPDAPSLFDRGDTHEPHLIDTACTDLLKRFDPTWGGFGGAPKFPQPTLVDVALRMPGPGQAAALFTLDAMAAGGIHDQLGGGFARYSTDGEWLVPHFEKMLYDQAGLLRAYTHAWLLTSQDSYRHVMDGIVTYVARDLALSEGGIQSAEDADSEGVEGRFYVWSPSQISDVLGATAATAFCAFYDVTPEGNFEGASILRRPVGADLVDPEIEEGRQRLLEARSTRIRPGVDDKVLCEWNAMYASALAEAAAATGEATWTEAAVAIGEFLWTHLRTEDGRVLRSWQRDGGARHLAFASDYAWLVDCYTRLGELTGEQRWTERAVTTADALLELFQDPDDGGFFTTGTDGETLIVRAKDLLDGATPSANGIAALALVRLGARTGSERFTAAARRVVDLLGSLLERHPTAFAQSVLAADLLLSGISEIVVPGQPGSLLAEVRRHWLPTAVVAWGEADGSPLFVDRHEGSAYVCQGFTCKLPATDPQVLADQLRALAP